MRILSYGDANRHRRDLLELATAGFMRLVQVDFTKISVANSFNSLVSYMSRWLQLGSSQHTCAHKLFSFMQMMATVCCELSINSAQTKFPRNC